MTVSARANGWYWPSLREIVNLTKFVGLGTLADVEKNRMVAVLSGRLFFRRNVFFFAQARPIPVL